VGVDQYNSQCNKKPGQDGLPGLSLLQVAVPNIRKQENLKNPRKLEKTGKIINKGKNELHNIGN
jgi:hypothetical protein